MPAPPCPWPEKLLPKPASKVVTTWKPKQRDPLPQNELEILDHLIEDWGTVKHDVNGGMYEFAHWQWTRNDGSAIGGPLRLYGPLPSNVMGRIYELFDKNQIGPAIGPSA